MYWSIGRLSRMSTFVHYCRVIFGGLLALSFLLLIGCSPSDTTKREPANSTSAPSSPIVKKDNYITANPNPVPAGPGNGTTTISWQTQGLPALDVHVFVIGGDGMERLFATGSEGSQAAPWITSDAPAEFSLVFGSGANRKLLDKVVVTRNK